MNSLHAVRNAALRLASSPPRRAGQARVQPVRLILVSSFPMQGAGVEHRGHRCPQRPVFRLLSLARVAMTEEDE